MPNRIKRIREDAGVKRRHAAGLIGRSVRCVQDWEREINGEDDALVDYLALLVGHLTIDEARKRAIERLRCAKKTG